MPIVDGKYVAPTWVNGSAPYIDEDEMQAMSDSIEANQTGLDGKAPTDHAGAGTGYGKGTSTAYGHVKLSDTPDASLDADGGAAATPKALYSVLSTGGQYTGTGQSGSGSPNQITVNRSPSEVIVTYKSGTLGPMGVLRLYPKNGVGVFSYFTGSAFKANENVIVNVNYDSILKKVTWYAQTGIYAAIEQCNSNGELYAYTVQY